MAYLRLIACILAALPTLVSAGADTAQEVKVGLIVPLSGHASALGRKMAAGAELGIEDLRKHAEIDAELIIVDSQGSAKRADMDYRMLALREKVSVVIGGATTGESSVLVELAGKMNIPTIILGATDKQSEKVRSGHILHMGTSPEEIYRSTLAWWVEPNQPRNVVVLYDKSHDILYQYGAAIAPQWELSSHRRIYCNAWDIGCERLSVWV